jgi:hypothetical protein
LFFEIVFIPSRTSAVGVACQRSFQTRIEKRRVCA